MRPDLLTPRSLNRAKRATSAIEAEGRRLLRFAAAAADRQDVVVTVAT